MRKTLFGFNKKEVNETIDTLTNQNTALIQRNDRLEEDLKDLKMQLEEAKVANEGLMSRAECSDYENIKSNFDALANENKQLSIDVQNARNEAAESQGALAQAQNEAVEAKQALEQAQNEAAEIKQACAQAQNEAVEAKQAFEQAQNEAAEIKQAYTQAQSEAAESKHALEQAQNETAEIKQAYAQAQSEAAQARQALEQVQNENYNTKLELERAKDDLNNANENVKKLMSENAISSNEKIAKAQKDAYMAAQELEQQQNENMQLKLQLKTVQAQLEAAIQKNETEAAARNEGVSEYLNALQMACSKIDNSKGEIGEKMRSAIEKFIDEWTNAENDLREMTAKVDEARMNAQSEFVNSTNSMLNALEQIEQYNSQMSDNINDIEVRKLELKEELENIIDEFAQKPMLTDDDTEEDVAAPPDNTVHKPENEYIRFVSNR